MNWKLKMLNAMQLMREACTENESWCECCNCPMDCLCNKLQNEDEDFETVADLLMKEIENYTGSHLETLFDKEEDSNEKLF